MKLKLEDKLKIIAMYEVGHPISSISKKFKVCKSVVERIERQYREHLNQITQMLLGLNFA